MESYLDKNDELRVEFSKLEHIMGPEDSKVNQMYILTKASRSGSRTFEILSTSGSGYLVASRNRLVKYQELKIAQQEILQRRARKDGDKFNLCWTEAGERLGKKNVEVFRGQRKHKSFPCEAGIDMVRIARQVKVRKAPI